jgi:hypothetical protein
MSSGRADEQPEAIVRWGEHGIHPRIEYNGVFYGKMFTVARGEHDVGFKFNWWGTSAGLNDPLVGPISDKNLPRAVLVAWNNF